MRYLNLSFNDRIKVASGLFSLPYTMVKIATLLEEINPLIVTIGDRLCFESMDEFESFINKLKS
jgi:hypothetical protein